MLEYQIDTFGGKAILLHQSLTITKRLSGNSGSPVFRKSDLVSLRAHVYGGTFNSASVIGKYSNPYNDYLAAFDLPVPNDGLNLIPVTGNSAINAPVPSGFGESLPNSMKTTNGPAICEVCRTRQVKSAPMNAPAVPTFAAPSPVKAPAPPARSLFSGSVPSAHNGGFSRLQAPLSSRQVGSADEEGFFLDILKKAASVGAPLIGKALNTALPVALGPIGGPVGALAGFALNTAGKLCESAEAESAMDGPPILHEGAMERAVLAEAVLTFLQTKELNHEAEESIFSDMKDTVIKALPTVRKAAAQVLPAMMAPALRIALESLHKYNNPSGNGAESFEADAQEAFRPGIVYTHAIDQPADRRAEAFLSNLHAAMNKHAEESAMDEGSAEGFFDFIKCGVRLAGQGIGTLAQTGLPILVKAIASQTSGTESLEDGPAPEQSHAFSSDALAHRAIVAEAALQAVMKQPIEHLQEEGFFDFISSAVKTIAPIALKVAPSVVSAINPTVGKIVKGVLGQESTMVGEFTPGALNGYHSSSTPRRRLDAPQLRPRKSLATLRNEGGAGRTDNYEGVRQQDNGPRTPYRQSGFRQREY